MYKHTFTPNNLQIKQNKTIIIVLSAEPFQAWIYHPLQAANYCRNSRLVVDENDLKWFKN